MGTLINNRQTEERGVWTNALWETHCEKVNVDGGLWAFQESVEIILSELIKGEGVAGSPIISVLISVVSSLTALARGVGPSSKIVLR